MQYVLFEDKTALQFLPLTYTRPIFALRFGIGTIIEKWAGALSKPVAGMTFRNFRHKFDTYVPDGDTVFINGKLLPDAQFIENVVHTLSPNQGYLNDDNSEVLAFRTDAGYMSELHEHENLVSLKALPLNISFHNYPHTRRLRQINSLPDLFLMNREQIKLDFAVLTRNRTSAPVEDRHTIVYNPENIFLEPGVKLRAAILNAEDGPIYIGAGAEICEGAVIHGAHAIHDHVTVQMGAKLRGDSTIGPWCKIGGELSNSVFLGFSNKNHDGFIGNSIIGEWCNFGAGTNVSNLKNNYSPVKIYDHLKDKMVDTELQFCGLIMGDYCRCGINTLFNTGTVVDVCANIFGSGFPPKFIPSFSWGNIRSLETYQLEKAFVTIERIMQRRNCELTPDDRLSLLTVFEQTEKYRYWDKP